MATALAYNTAKSIVKAWLQATRTAYATTVDGSKRSFASDTEIDNAILNTDGEICHLIIGTIGHPYQNGFAQTSSALSSGATIPAHNGMILKVVCLNGQSDVTITSVTNATDLLTVSGGHGLLQGQKVRISNSGGGLPSGLSAATDYWVIYISSTTFKLASTPYNAGASVPVNLTTDGTGTQTVHPQYVDGIQAKSADEVKQILALGNVYKHDISTNNGLLPFWFIEGNVLYLTTIYGKVIYTDYTLTSSPQAPEPYLYAVCAGAMAKLLKDGGDTETHAYYNNEFDKAKQMIIAGARTVPAISAYK